MAPSDGHYLYERDESRGAAIPAGGTTLVATSAVVARGNDKRKRLTIVNDSDTKMYPAMAAKAIAGRGFVIYPGGTFTIQSDPLGYLWVGPVSLISSAAKNFTLTEET